METMKCIFFVKTKEENSALLQDTAEFVLDGNTIRNKSDLMKMLSETMHFPDYFGSNWDALEDCLCDLAWLSVDNYRLLWINASQFFYERPKDFFVFIEIITSVALWWKSQDKTFELYLVDDILFKDLNIFFNYAVLYE